MFELESRFILGGDGRTVVKVFEPNKAVSYPPSKNHVNYTYYLDGSGKRWKSRAYGQYSAMVGRCLAGGSYHEIFKAYDGVSMSPKFEKFDLWYAWAVNQVGFMCLDNGVHLYQQDKDILGDGSYYSPDICCFVPIYVNSFYNSLNGMNVESCRKFYTKAFNLDFQNLDERVVDKMMTDCSHNYNLSVKMREDMEKKELAVWTEKIRRLTSRVTLSNNSDIYTYVRFDVNFWYIIGSFYDVDESEKKKKFIRVVDAIKHYFICRNISNKSIMREVMEISEGGNKYLDECLVAINRTKTLQEDFKNKKLKIFDFVKVDVDY